MYPQHFECVLHEWNIHLKLNRNVWALHGSWTADSTVTDRMWQHVETQCNPCLKHDPTCAVLELDALSLLPRKLLMSP